MYEKKCEKTRSVPMINKMIRPITELSPPNKSPAAAMGIMNMIETMKPANNVMMDGLIRSLSANTICQACFKNAQPLEKFCMIYLLILIFFGE